MGNSSSAQAEEFHAAARRLDIEAITKAAERFKESDFDIDARGREGRSALHIAAGQRRVCKSKRLKAVRELVRLGASIKYCDDRGFTVLHHACTTGDLQLVEYLQLEGAATPTRDNFGLSPGDVLPTGSVSSPSLYAESEGYKLAVSAQYSAKRETYILNISFEAPADHSDKDFVQVCYTQDEKWKLVRRIGSFVYLPEGSAGTFKILVPEEGVYRMLCTQEDGTVVAISTPVVASIAAVRTVRSLSGADNKEVKASAVLVRDATATNEQTKSSEPDDAPGTLVMPSKGTSPKQAPAPTSGTTTQVLNSAPVTVEPPATLDDVQL